MLNCGEARCLDIPCSMVDRGRTPLTLHVFVSPAWEAPVVETSPGVLIISDVWRGVLFPFRYSRSDPTLESIRSTILII